MSNDHDNKNAEPESDPTMEILRGRRFDLGEAIGREAGDSLKGASPVPAIQQMLLQIGELLAGGLDDGEGSLTRTILARLTDNPPFLATHRDDPAGALVTFIDQVLNTSTSLTELVRQTDARWGRDYDERPYFERRGQAPQPDDPYTDASVRTLLVRLRQTLNR